MLYLLEPERIVGLYAPLLITLVLAGVVAWRAAPGQRFRWLLAISVLAALFATGLWQMRGAAAATMAAAPVFVAGIVTLWPNIERADCCSPWCCSHRWCSAPAGRRCGRCSTGSIRRRGSLPRKTASRPAAPLPGSAPLATIPRGRMIAPIDLGPNILAATEHSVFAGPYHRNNDGNLAMIRAMMADPDTARRIPDGAAGRLRRALPGLAGVEGASGAGARWSGRAAGPRRGAGFPATGYPHAIRQSDGLARPALKSARDGEESMARPIRPAPESAFAPAYSIGR